MSDILTPPITPSTRKDYSSDQEVRWCPGCGDYSILAQMQKVLPELGIARENVVFISGIGCSSRFPYYMNTYGIHSIHGRAPTLASGLKIARPDLKVFVITGDGDALSIGGNHFLHVLRRNIDITVVLFNNRIYGLTKGQFSPTSLAGARTKSSPMGSIEQPLNPLSVALAAEATFIARSVDVEIKHLGEILTRAAQHKGASFVEVFQNCNIFNDGAWSHVTDSKVKKDHVLTLEHGKPMVFGGEVKKGLMLDRETFLPRVVELGGEYSESDLLVHDESRPDQALAYMLSRMTYPEFPVPMGVFRNLTRPVYEEGMLNQVAQAVEQKGKGDLRKLYFNADVWSVGADGSESKGEDVDVVAEMMAGWSDSLSPAQCQVATTRISQFKPVQAPRFAPQDSLSKVLAEMQQADSDCALICNAEGRLVGTFTESDIIRVALLVSKAEEVRIEQCMTSNPATLESDATMARALHQMSLHQTTHLPVVDAQGKPLGILTYAEVLGYLEGQPA